MAQTKIRTIPGSFRIDKGLRDDEPINAAAYRDWLAHKISTVAPEEQHSATIDDMKEGTLRYAKLLTPLDVANDKVAELEERAAQAAKILTGLYGRGNTAEQSDELRRLFGVPPDPTGDPLDTPEGRAALFQHWYLNSKLDSAREADVPQIRAEAERRARTSTEAAAWLANIGVMV